VNDVHLIFKFCKVQEQRGGGAVVGFFIVHLWKRRR